MNLLKKKSATLAVLLGILQSINIWRQSTRYVILFLTLLVANAPATALTINVLNNSFEDRVINTPGDYTLNDIPNWIVTGQTATFRPTTSQFPGGVPEGVNVAAAGNQIADGFISQTLTARLEADMIYTLKVDVGQRADFLLTSYMIELIAGEVTLASGSSLKPTPGYFLTDTIVFNSGANPLQLGQNLEIRLSGSGPGSPNDGQAEFDNVRLDATAAVVPVPAAMWLMGSGLLGLMGLSRKKKTH